MRVLIVDDERPARDKLRRLLEQEACVSAIEEARDGVEALERIAIFAPEVLLLDIQMPEISGLELAASLPSPAPLVVFVTAYDQYALRAFDANAIDYLLKPYDQQRLRRALQRVKERLMPQGVPPASMGAVDIAPGGEKNIDTAISGAALNSAAPGGNAVTQLLITERGVTHVVKVADIQWLESADNYVVLHTAGGQPLMRQTLAGLADTLGPRFVRCHRRAAVQLSWVASLVALDKGDAELILRGGARVPCSRQFRADVVARLQQGPTA